VNVQVSRTDEPTSVQVADQRNSEWIDLQLAQAELHDPSLRIVPWAEFPCPGKPTGCTPICGTAAHHRSGPGRTRGMP